MKAAICTKYGPPEVVRIEERRKPTPKNNEVLIRVHATTVASGDCRVRIANVPSLYKPVFPLIYGFGRPRQPIFGTELSGQIEAVGQNVTAFKVGDLVFAMTGLKMGAHAEYVTLAEKDKIVLKPDNISYEQAAAIAFGGTTALHFFRKTNLRQDQKILIYGASGAVGTSAVQIAKHFGAKVTGVCSGANMELVKSLGAVRVIDYTTEDFRKTGEKYDVIFDAVGKITKTSCKNTLAKNGTCITVNGNPASVRVEDLRLLGELMQNGQFTPVIDRIYPLEKIADAYAYVETGRKKGNVVITM
ncbi:MAG: NAD(P)-dependent alcohol dehydrogenase [Peptococcaceae bacterium]|nr:NAD(P)-dependent alcohol dehydrogenase [Peptococcaceae bacterium]